MSKTCLLAGLLLSLPVQAAPLINNGDFTSGLAGWTVSGSATTNTAASVLLPGGANAAILNTGGNAVSQASAESTFGLSSGALTPFGNLPPSSGITTGSTIFQDITSGLAGDSIQFDARWLGGDGGYDLAVAILGDQFDLAADQILAIGSGATGATGAQTLSFTLARDATVANPLRLGAFVTNTEDTSVGSMAALANVQGVAKVPEIDSSRALLPLSVVMIGLALLGGRRPLTQVALASEAI